MKNVNAIKKLQEADLNYGNEGRTSWHHEYKGSAYINIGGLNDKLSEAVQAGPDGAAAVMATLRLSAMRQLPWYAGGNYQGKDMAHMQEMVASRVAEASKSAESGMARQLFRIALSTLPRGGGNGLTN